MTATTNIQSTSFPKEVTHKEDPKEVHGLFVMPNGKEYKITRLIIDGEDYTNTKLDPEKLKDIKRIFNKIWEEKSKEIEKHKPDSLSVSIPNDPKAPVTITGRVGNATTDAFTTTLDFSIIEDYYKSLRQNLTKPTKVAQKTPPPPAKNNTPSQTNTPQPPQTNPPPPPPKQTPQAATKSPIAPIVPTQPAQVAVT